MGEDQLANINMDSILMSMAVWGICVKLYDIKSGETWGAVVLFSPPAALYSTLSDWGVPTLGLVEGREDGKRSWRRERSV